MQRARAATTRYLPGIALPRGLRIDARPRRGAAPCARRPGRHRHADGRRCARCSPRCPPTRPRAVAVQGLREPAAARSATRSRARCGRGARAACCRARASRRRWRAASPTALVAASADAALRDAAVAAFHGDALRVYTSDDPVGVEVGGAVKNVLAIATGIARRPAQARPERARRADHARPGRDDAPGRGAGRARRHLHGPVGPGRPGADRHRRPVAQPPGRPCAGAARAACRRCWPQLGHVAEGVYSAPVVLARARRWASRCRSRGAWSPCSKGAWTPRRRCAQLMGREARSET